MFPSSSVPEFVDHSKVPGLPDGPNGVKAILGAIRQAFPDHDAKIVHMVAEGNLVATYKTFTGTNLGPFFGKPTDRQAGDNPGDGLRPLSGRQDRRNTGTSSTWPG